MDGVRATVNGKKLVFASSGDLADTDRRRRSGGRTLDRRVHQEEERDHHTIDGASQPPLPAVYKFTKRNQLQVSVVVGGAETAAFTYPGRIRSTAVTTSPTS